VCATSACALVMSGVGREIVLMDVVNPARAAASANDIYHANSGAVHGTERDVLQAFRSAFMEIDWRIGLLISLPVVRPDQRTLVEKVAEIGTS
jgi:hypothetical protein